MERKTEPVGAVRKTLKIVDALWKLEEAGVTELSEYLGFSKSTVYVHLVTLERDGFVVAEDGIYQLGLRFLNLGESVKRRQPLYEAADPVIAELAAETGEQAFCMVEQHGLATVICASAGERAVNTNVRVGTHTFMHASSAGKAILAHLPDERVAEILDRWELRRFTENTITDRETLFAQLEEGRESGYFVSHEEYRHGVATIGAPVLGEDRVFGSVTIFGPATRIANSRSDTNLQDEVRAAANQIGVNVTVP